MKRKAVKERFFIGVLVFTFVLGLGTVAQAAPELGVGTGTFDCTGALEYWGCFSGNSASGSGESFAIPPSGTTDGVTLWVDKDTFDGYNIWLIGDPSLSSFSFTVDGTTYNSVALGDVGTFDGYVTPYYGINLGEVDGDWEAIVPGVFPHNAGNDFFSLTGTFAYTDPNIEGNWLFIVAENDGLDGDHFGDSGHDQFSPKTTSAVGVPEPGAVLLLGTGLLGLVAYRRRFRK